MYVCNHVLRDDPHHSHYSHYGRRQSLKTGEDSKDRPSCISRFSRDSKIERTKIDT